MNKQVTTFVLEDVKDKDTVTIVYTNGDVSVSVSTPGADFQLLISRDFISYLNKRTSEARI
jgi:hypothetical protein